MAKITALQEAYNENRKLQSTIEQLQRRLNVVTIDTYNDLEENHKQVVEESRQLHTTINELEKTLRKLNSDKLNSKDTVSHEDWEDQANEILDLKKIIFQMENSKEIVSKVKYAKLQESLATLNKENKSLHKQLEELKRDYIKTVEQHKGYSELAYNYKCALNEIEQLKRKSKELPRKHNERGAGRKPLDADTIKRVHELTMNNISIREIQRTLSLEGILVSVGAIHKAIKGTL